MALSIDRLTKVITVPKADTTLIQLNPIEIRELDLDAFRLELKSIEDSDEGMPFLDTHQHNTTVDIGGVTLARVIEIINGYTVTFENGAYRVNLVGANSNVADVQNLNTVQVASNNSAGLIQTREIEHASFNDGVTIDVINGVAGTLYPIGTQVEPVNNLDDALLIATVRGFTMLRLVGSLTITAADTLIGMKITGQSRKLSLLTIDSGATITDLDVHECTVSGVFGGGSTMEDCAVSSLSVFDGLLLRCFLETTITLGNSAAARFVDCYSAVPGASTPILDMGGSGQSLLMRNYTGGIEIQNRTGTDPCSIDMHSGQIIVDSTVTAGTIILRGVGKLTDNSGPGATIDATDLISGQDFLNLRDATIAAIEYQRGSHTAEVYLYVDPVNGDNANDGLSRSAPKLTVAAALAAITQEHTAIIVLGATTGQQVITENITLATRFTFLRGPGLDIRLVGASDASPTISITAAGCEVSGFEVITPGTGTPDAISVTAEFARLRRLRVLNARRHGVNCDNGDRLRVEECIIEGSGAAGAGNGLLIANTDFALIDVKTIITGSADDNIIVDPNGGTAVDNVLDDITVTNSIGGVGINVVTGAARTRITNVSFSGNNSGDINNNGTGTVVHGTVLANYNGVVFVDPLGTAGVSFPVGTMEVPVSNLADAYVIADGAQIDRFFIQGDVTVPSARSNALFEGRDISVELDLDGQNLDGSVIRRLTVVNDGAGADLIFEDCFLNSTSNWVGEAKQCRIEGVISLANGETAMLECFSAVEGLATPVIDLVGAGRELGMRIYSGGIEIRNMTDSTNLVSVDVVAGQVVLPASNIGGTITIRGNGNLTDNSAGATVEHNALVNLSDIDVELTGTHGSGTWQQGAVPGDAMTLTSAERDAIANALLDLANGVESSVTVREFFRAVGSVLAGDIPTPGGPGVSDFRAIGNPGTLRVTSTADENGDRTIVLSV